MPRIASQALGKEAMHKSSPFRHPSLHDKKVSKWNDEHHPFTDHRHRDPECNSSSPVAIPSPVVSYRTESAAFYNQNRGTSMSLAACTISCFFTTLVKKASRPPNKPKTSDACSIVVSGRCSVPASAVSPERNELLTPYRTHSLGLAEILDIEHFHARRVLFQRLVYVEIIRAEYLIGLQ